ncbi:hypothetical protein CVT24_003624 [Panaeolus cyanescens]|uniref:Gfd2/YDR514C-like C-terminal domain-containing protein n=1 Tax=Panaeolus cyanescens TaxID=181874 RepID=A0A409Y7Y9_9AGAR|nr:hypothetical protein CVT24_003624 [Panaeolus cyanescens]
MPKDTPVVTGYYRYTDIWHEWHKALPNPEDGKRVKAILAHDSIVHPDHPLHVEGVNGVQLYLGTLHTGEARLLFSSAQVDYIRYWLHAMQLTKEMIPLPYSDCLLTKSNLRTVSPVVYPDGFSLRNALKVIDKNNKRLKGSARPYTTQCRFSFEDVRARWNDKRGVWLALDFEAWERDHTVLTEFGWSLVRWEDDREIKETGHLIVDEHQKYTNTQYVKNYNPASRYRFHFGTQEIVNRKTFTSRIKDIIETQRQYGPLYLVFHNESQDTKYLASLGISLEGLSNLPLLPGSTEPPFMLVDTSELIAALLGSDKGDSKGLSKTCHLLSIPTKDLHNAGNDACYTMLALEAMASGAPVDEQSQQRWPKQAPTNGVKVPLQAWQEDSDFSDMEGVAGSFKAA